MIDMWGWIVVAALVRRLVFQTVDDDFYKWRTQLFSEWEMSVLMSERIPAIRQIWLQGYGIISSSWKGIFSILSFLLSPLRGVRCVAMILRIWL